MNFIKDVLSNTVVTSIEMGGVYFLVKFAKSNKDKKQNHALISC